jgi:hypothetical protein
MRLIIQSNPDEVSSWVASYVVKRIKAFAPTPERPFVLGACAHQPPATATSFPPIFPVARLGRPPCTAHARAALPPTPRTAVCPMSSPPLAAAASRRALTSRTHSHTPARPHPHALAGLPTGGSPLLMYKKLIQLHKAGEISFANVVTFKCVAPAVAVGAAAAARA